MATFHVNHIKAAIGNRFNNLIDLSDVQPPEIEDCFLTRGLSAFVIAELTGAEDPASAAAVVDCPRDNGIDALYFDSAERAGYLVQSKWIKSGNGSVDVGSVLKFAKGVDDFFQGDLDAFGPKIKARRAGIEEMLADSRNTFTIVLAYTGQHTLSSDAQRALDDLLQKLNDTTEFVGLRVLKQKDLHDIVAQGALGENVNLKIMLKEFGNVPEPYAAHYGQVDLKDIATWGKYGNHLYAKNIRGFKGSTDVNDAIVHTIKTNPKNFWYFNNGVTVVASKVTPQPLGSGNHQGRVFDCEGASVVNGAQTVGSIISAVNSGSNNLQNASVLVRIISLEDCPEAFGAELTKAANTQNKIESKDFAAQDPEQARLAQDLFLENSKHYVYRSGDNAPTPTEGLTFEEAAVALACAQADVTWAVQAKREVGKLWEDITKAPYTIFFNKGTNALRMWRAVEIMRAVEAELKAFQAIHEGKPKLIATHGNRFVLHMLFDSVLDPDELDLDKTLAKTPDAVKTMLNELIPTAMKWLERSYPSNLFKNLSKCKEIVLAMTPKPKGATSLKE